jgi:hypothetical protein
MSADEQAQSIGRLVLAAGASKQKLVALASSAATATEQLQKVAGMIAGIRQGIEYLPSEFDNALAALPSAVQLGQLVQEFLAEERRSKELAAQIAKLGI